MPLIALVLLLPFLMAASGDPILDLVAALMGGNGRMAIAAGLSLVMALCASARERISWLRGDRGGTLLVLFLAFGGAIVSALMGGLAITYQLFLTSLEIGLIAIGGYTGIRRVFWPKDRAASAPAPSVEPPAAAPPSPVVH